MGINKHVNKQQPPSSTTTTTTVEERKFNSKRWKPVVYRSKKRRERKGVNGTKE